MTSNRLQVLNKTKQTLQIDVSGGTDGSGYIVLSYDSQDKPVKLRFKQVYDLDRGNYLAVNKYGKRLLNSEFICIKCLDKSSCKYGYSGISKKQTDLNFECFENVLEVFHEVAVSSLEKFRRMKSV